MAANPITSKLTSWMHGEETAVHTTTPRTIRQPRPPAAVRPIDILGLTTLLDRRPERILAIPEATSDGAGFAASATGPIIKAPEPEARGPEQIADRLAKAGATVRLAADGEHLVVSAARGVVPKAGVVEVIDRYQRLLLGHLAGTPVLCEITAHGGKPPAAVTIVLGGAAWCGSCGPKESK